VSDIVKLRWDKEIGFLGYTVGRGVGLYSSILTLPRAAQEEAAKVVLEKEQRERSRAAETTMRGGEFKADPETFSLHPHLSPELDYAEQLLAELEDDRPAGRPIQAFCQEGHPMAAAYVRPNGKRDCRLCTAARNRESRARRQVAM